MKEMWRRCDHCGARIGDHCQYCTMCACTCDELGHAEGEHES